MLYQSHNSLGTDYFNPIMYDDLCFLPHLHRHCEAVLVLEGEVSVTVDGNTELAHSGDAAIILGNQLHSFYTDGTSKVWVCVFSEDYASSFFKKLQGKRGVRSVFHCPEPVMSYFLYSGSCDCESEHCARKAFMYMLCSEYLRQLPLTESTNSGGDLLHKIMTYVSDHFRDDITLTKIASELGYEPHYLSRFFHKTVKLNLRTLINQYRVSYAEGLLSNTSLSMTEVAAECGFQSVRNFNRVFLSETGRVPSSVSPKSDRSGQRSASTSRAEKERMETEK